MPKSYLKALFVLLLFASMRAVAQQPQEIFDRYLVKYPHFSPADFYVEDRFLVANPLPDSLNIQIDTVADLQKVIDKHLQAKVYAVEIRNARKKDLQKIFAVLAQFPQLVFLKIDDVFFPDPKASLYKIPANITSLQNLKGIEFYFTNNIDLDDAFTKLTALKQLNTLAISGYNKPAPPSLSKLTGLRYIKMLAKNLENFEPNNYVWQKVVLAGSAPKQGPDAEVLSKLADIKSITSLTLESYMLGDASAIPKLNSLNTLYVTGCYLKSNASLFGSIGQLNNLTNLIVRHFSDSIQTLSGIEKLKKLQHLDLAMPVLGKDPSQLNLIAGLKNLQSLYILSSNLSALPDIFGGLKQLKYVTLDANVLTELPRGLFNLPNLESLSAGSNKLRHLPGAKQYGSKNLKKLLLSYNGLVELPDAVTQLPNLEILKAGANKISKTPANWQNLKNLKNVDLSKNQLPVFPGNLQLLTTVENIDLSDNNIAAIPDITGEGYQLKSLSISSNELTTLPANLGKYAKLESLLVDGNRLTALPESLGDCKNLNIIDAHSSFRNFSFDVDKLKDARFKYFVKDSTKVNNIKTLPAGLKGAKNLQSINLNNNSHLDSKQVFDILLSLPHKNLRVKLSDDAIAELPTDARWANTHFFELDLSRNKLQTLPAQFAGIGLGYEILLYRNPFKVLGGTFNGEIRTKADLVILFEDMGIALPEGVISKREYAAALAKQVTTFYYAEKWQQGVESAQRSFKNDSVVYNQNIRWDHVGTCRFKTGDYKGAIKDFDRYLAQQNGGGFRIMNFIDPVISYKVQSHLALGQPIEAAKTYEYYYKEFHGQTALQQAAVIYKSIGYEKQFNKLIDTAVADGEKAMAYNLKSKQPSIAQALDYAELLLIAGKPGQVADLMNKEYRYPSKSNLATKSYLIATAQYLINNQQFDSLKKSLSDAVAVNGKITGWDFEMFNTWLAHSGFSKTKQQQLLDLQNIAK